MQFLYGRSALFFIFVFTSSLLSSQVNSPYSRFGLGNIHAFSFEASNGLAGISTCFFSSGNINFGNPASYADINNAMFEIGGNGTVLDLETNDESYTGGDGNLSYLAFAFPYLKKLRNQKFGLSIGLIPYSSFQYNIFEEINIGDSILGIQQNNYVGKGDLYQFYGGTGYSVQTDTSMRKKANGDTLVSRTTFAFGGNVAYLFGSLSNITYASFPDQPNSQTTKLERENLVGGLTYNFGLGIKRTIVINKQDLSVWAFGASYQPQITVDGLQSILWTNILKNGNYEFTTDTLYIAPDTSGQITLPSTYKAGLSYTFLSSDLKKNQFSIFTEYAMNNWSEYRGFQSSGSLVDSWRISVGAEFLPFQDNERKLPLAIRAGFYTGTSYLMIDNVQLTERGGSIGFGIPIANSLSRVNLSAQIGTRGNTDIIKETVYRFGIGFTLVDTQWFRTFKLN